MDKIEIVRKIQELMPELTDEVLDLLVQYIKKEIVDDMKKAGF